MSKAERSRSRSLRGWIAPRRTLRLTRDGWFFLAVTMAIGFASLNTGHNLFYLIFAMQVSLVIVSGLLSERAVRSLRVERLLPRELFARAAVAIEVRVENRDRRRASYAVEIRDSIHGLPRRRVGFVDRLDPGESRSFSGVWSFPRRGRYGFDAIVLVTRFPFGLFEKSRIVPLEEEFLVYPAVERASGRAAAAELQRATSRKNRLGEEILGFRRKMPEDDRRHIHWKTSARIGELVVKDPGDTLERPVAIFFDSRGDLGEAFEAVVERAANLLLQICRESRRVNFYSWRFAALGVGSDSWGRVLDYLAEVEPSPEDGGGECFARWLGEASRGGAGVFVTASEPPALPPGTLLRVA